MAELVWGDPRWLTEEEFAAEVTDPVERWFWQTFTGWQPPVDQQEGADDAAA